MSFTLLLSVPELYAPLDRDSNVIIPFYSQDKTLNYIAFSISDDLKRNGVALLKQTPSILLSTSNIVSEFEGKYYLYVILVDKAEFYPSTSIYPCDTTYVSWMDGSTGFQNSNNTVQEFFSSTTSNQLIISEQRGDIIISRKEILLTVEKMPVLYDTPAGSHNSLWLHDFIPLNMESNHPLYVVTLVYVEWRDLRGLAQHFISYLFLKRDLDTEIEVVKEIEGEEKNAILTKHYVDKAVNKRSLTNNMKHSLAFINGNAPMMRIMDFTQEDGKEIEYYPEDFIFCGRVARPSRYLFSNVIESNIVKAQLSQKVSLALDIFQKTLELHPEKDPLTTVVKEIYRRYRMHMEVCVL